MNWPDDADGDVLRGLRQRDFDFSRPVQVDFNVDFEEWPPNPNAVAAIAAAFPLSVISVEEDGGYLLVKLSQMLTYEWVTHVQESLSRITATFGGNCNSWGVLH